MIKPLRLVAVTALAVHTTAAPFAHADEPTTLRLDDDADDAGADVEFEPEQGGDDWRDVRIDGQARAFGRMTVDLAHDRTLMGDDGRVEGHEDTFSSRLHGRGEATARFGRWAKLKAAGRFDAEVAFDREPAMGVERRELQIWDSYADLYGDWFDLRLGNQLITWGYADLLSPNDVINPRDLRRGSLVPIDEQRIPILAAKATAYAGPLSLQAAWLPFAPTDRFELVDGDYAVLGPNALTRNERRIGTLLDEFSDDPRIADTLAPVLAIGHTPPRRLSSGELAASAAVRTGRVDVATYALWGHERTPRISAADPVVELFNVRDPSILTPGTLGLTFSRLDEMGIDPVAVDYPRRLYLGAAAAGRIEPLGLKLEAAMSPRTNAILVPDGKGVLAGHPDALPQGTVAGGFDLETIPGLNVVVEASYARVFGVPAGERVYRYDGAHLVTVGSQIDWRAGRLITLRMLGFVDVTSPSYLVMPAIRLSGHDNLAAELAVGLYGGPPNSLGGSFGRNDEVVLTIEYGL